MGVMDTDLLGPACAPPSAIEQAASDPAGIRSSHGYSSLTARVVPEPGPPSAPWSQGWSRESGLRKSLGVSSNVDDHPKGLIPLIGGSTSASWPWPDDLDAMIAAPGFHTVLFENDRVRVLDGRVPPGATVPVHTHRWGGVLYILATSDFVRRDPDGNVLADTRASKSTPILGNAVWGAPLTPHSLENVGTQEFRTLTVEMKDGS